MCVCGLPSGALCKLFCVLGGCEVCVGVCGGVCAQFDSSIFGTV